MHGVELWAIATEWVKGESMTTSTMDLIYSFSTPGSDQTWACCSTHQGVCTIFKGRFTICQESASAKSRRGRLLAEAMAPAPRKRGRLSLDKGRSEIPPNTQTIGHYSQNAPENPRRPKMAKMSQSSKVDPSSGAPGTCPSGNELSRDQDSSSLAPRDLQVAKGQSIALVDQPAVSILLFFPSLYLGLDIM
jgi:hypothetical protein